MSIYKRRSGRWAVRIDLDAGATGARRRRSLGTFATRKEAERAERDALTSRDRGIELLAASVTVADLLARFIRDRESLGRGAKTVEEYRRSADLYVVPHLGSIMVAKLKPATISGWVATLLERGGVKDRPISAKTAKHALSLLSSALRWGVRLELVGRNVCDAVEPPSPLRSQAKALTGPEIAALLTTARGTRWEAFVSLALMLGARRGELLALRWVDVDVETGTVVVRGSLSQTRAGVTLKGTKTGRARTIPLAVAAREAFRKQRLMQVEDRLRAGSLYNQDATDPVFTDQFGRSLAPMVATEAFRTLARRAGITTTSLHSARHTAATTMIGAGVDVRTAASILGHTTANVTLALYSHVIEGAERPAVDKISERLDGLMSPRTPASPVQGRATRKR